MATTQPRAAPMVLISNPVIDPVPIMAELLREDDAFTAVLTNEHGQVAHTIVFASSVSGLEAMDLLELVVEDLRHWTPSPPLPTAIRIAE